MGKRGAVVIPAALRRRFGIKEGSFVLAEARDGGMLIRPAVALPVDEYRRPVLEEVDRGYAALRQDPGAWQAELAERKLFEDTLLAAHRQHAAAVNSGATAPTGGRIEGGK